MGSTYYFRHKNENKKLNLKKKEKLHINDNKKEDTKKNIKIHKSKRTDNTKSKSHKKNTKRKQRLQIRKCVVKFDKIKLILSLRRAFNNSAENTI